MNSTKPGGQTDGHKGQNEELKDGDDVSEEEKPVFTGGLRRSKRQVSFHTMSLFLLTHTLELTQTAQSQKHVACISSVTMRETSGLRNANTINISQMKLSVCVDEATFPHAC